MNTTPYIMTDDQLVAYQSNDGQPMADSKTVADKFGKQHKNVIQSIENLDCSYDFARLNFQLSYWQDSTGRKNKMYLMTRDGFSFLVMGFTGPRAALWKETYIHAFNAMEAKLRNNQPAIPNFENPAEAARAWAEQWEKAKALEPKGEAFDSFMSKPESSYAPTAAMKALGYKPNLGLKFLRFQRVFHSTRHNNNTPNSYMMDHGYAGTYCTDLADHDKTQTYITREGIEYLRKHMSKYAPASLRSQKIAA